MTLIKIICLKEILFELISYVKSRSTLYQSIIAQKRHEINEFCFFSLLEDLKIILLLIENDKDFSLHFDRDLPILNNSFEYFERSRREIRKRIGIILNWTQNDLACILEYLKKNDEVSVIRSKDAIREIYNTCKSCISKDGKRTIFQMLKDIKGIFQTKIKQNENSADYFLTESKVNKSKSFKRMRYENFRIIDRIVKASLKKNTLYTGIIWNEKIFKNQKMLPHSTKSDTKEIKEDVDFIIEKDLEKSKRKIYDHAADNYESCKEFLDFIKDHYGIADDCEILELLGKASGDANDLILYLNTSDEKILWNSNEDEILLNLKSREDFAFKILAMYKGEEKIKKRLNFKSMEFPFEL